MEEITWKQFKTKGYNSDIIVTLKNGYVTEVEVKCIDEFFAGKTVLELLLLTSIFYPYEYKKFVTAIALEMRAHGVTVPKEWYQSI